MVQRLQRVVRVARPVVRSALQLTATVFAATFAVRLAVEVSIDGGIERVLLPPGTSVDDPAAAAVVEQYRLDRGQIGRHIGWLTDAVRGDFGSSSRFRGQPVAELIEPRLPITFQLSLVSLGLAMVIGVPAGVAAASLRPATGSQWFSLGLDVLRAVPVFILAPFLGLVFAVQLEWLPLVGWERPSVSLTGNVRSMTLPALTLALPEAAVVAQLIKSGLEEVRTQEYIVAARSKGLPRRHVFLHHALRPASFTAVTQLGLILSSLLAGVIIVEQIFAIGGMGALVFESTTNRDLDVLLAATWYLTILVVAVRLASDGLYRWMDPRIR